MVGARLQSLPYRSPEVILGLPYGCAIDMWSVACILAELYAGHRLFLAKDEHGLIALIIERLGPPETSLVENSPRKSEFFKNPHSESFVGSENCGGDDGTAPAQEWDSETSLVDDSPRTSKFSENSPSEPFVGLENCGGDDGTAPVKELGSEHSAFFELFYACLRWDPKSRWTPEMASLCLFINQDAPVV